MLQLIQIILAAKSCSSGTQYSGFKLKVVDNCPYETICIDKTEENELFNILKMFWSFDLQLCAVWDLDNCGSNCNEIQGRCEDLCGKKCSVVKKEVQRKFSYQLDGIPIPDFIWNMLPTINIKYSNMLVCSTGNDLPNKAGSNTTMIVIIAIVSVLAIIIIGALLFIINRKKKQTPTKMIQQKMQNYI
ncbi:Hypothetical_protein [Hexamita inflata]|uniref:Hypothetical_protein n=1 Tax=Hexamita inflata TaxID=28002 RepID=A0AA86TX25_9EUKA|nr:Hypothetical protein HINF_LOCUS19754 [Hexamita inflata]